PHLTDCIEKFHNHYIYRALNEYNLREHANEEDFPTYYDYLRKCEYCCDNCYFDVYCKCRKLDRSSVIEGGKLVHQPLSLKMSSALFLRAYCFTNKVKMFNSKEIPHQLKVFIATAGVLQNQLDRSLQYGVEERKQINIRKKARERAVQMNKQMNQIELILLQRYNALRLRSP